MSWASYARERTDSPRFAPISQSVRSSVAYCRCSRGCWETENWILAHAYLQSISRSTALSLGSGLGTSHSGDRSHKTSIAKSSRRKDIANMSRLHIRAYNHQYSGWILGSFTSLRPSQSSSHLLMDSIALCTPHILENVHAFVSSSKVTVGWICIVLTEKVVRSNSRSFVLSDGEPKSKW